MPRKLLNGLAIAALWIALWAVLARAVGLTLLLPSPLETLSALVTLVQRGDFWLAAGASMLRIFAGFAAGLVAGCALAVLTSRFRWWRGFFAPFLAAVKATPVASFIILALVWIKTDGVPTFATVLVVLPVAYTNLYTAIAATDPMLLEMARAFRMPRRALLTRIYWPSCRPAFLASVIAGMGMAWKAGIAAEVICTPRSALGTFLYSAKIYLDTPGLFAGTAVVILLSILLEKLVVWLTHGREGRRLHA